MTRPSWKVHVDPDLCEGHALCVQIAGDVFSLGDDDFAEYAEHPDDSSWDAVQSAISACPRQAISVTEGP